jgi:sec-independent protein translocase protein TatB
MLLDMGWSELMLIGMVALVVIGPKDLPKALRVAGFWVRKARTLSREFQSSVEQMVREAELDEVRDQLKKRARSTSTRSFAGPSTRPGALPKA